jgi:hypothetical protein
MDLYLEGKVLLNHSTKESIEQYRLPYPEQMMSLPLFRNQDPTLAG